MNSTKITTRTLDQYKRAIQACYDVHQTWLNTKQILATLRQERHEREIDLVLNDLECATYIAQGSNEQARRDRREWETSRRLAEKDQEIADIEGRVLLYEADYEHAHQLVRYWQLVVVTELRMDRDNATKELR